MTILQLSNVDNSLIWRIVLAVPAIPAFGLLMMRKELPETPTWLVERGRFIQAKFASKTFYKDDFLDALLPDENVHIEQPKVNQVLKKIFKNKFSKKTTIFGWISCAVQSFENYAFSFYLPFILVTIGISGQIQNNLALIFINCIAATSAFVGPLLLPKLGHKGISQWGFLMVTIGILISAY